VSWSAGWWSAAPGSTASTTYRYSVLPLVLATLLREGRLTGDDLHGLGQDKLEAIRRATHFFGQGRILASA